MNLLLGLVTFLVTLHGAVTYYNLGLMDIAYANHLRYGHLEPCPNCIGRIAVPDPQYTGWHAYITFPGRPVSGPYLVADNGVLSTPGRIAELEFALAEDLGIVGRGPLHNVTIFLMEPR